LDWSREEILQYRISSLLESCEDDWQDIYQKFGIKFILEKIYLITITPNLMGRANTNTYVIKGFLKLTEKRFYFSFSDYEVTK